MERKEKLRIRAMRMNNLKEMFGVKRIDRMRKERFMECEGRCK